MNWKKTVCLLGAVFCCTSLLMADQPASSHQGAVAVQKATVAQEQSVKPSAIATSEEVARKEANRTAKPSIEAQKSAIAAHPEVVTLSNKAPMNGRDVPENDDCANAIALTGTIVDLAFDTTEATYDGPGSCMTSPNIWYCWTADTSGTAYVGLCDSAFDTMVAVYDGCGCDSFTLLGCNDDSCGLQSELEFTAVAGQTYLIEVGAYSSYTGTGYLDVIPAGPGACCVDAVCVATNYEDECDALGGHWYAGYDCATFTCPTPGEGDYCEDPIVVTAPYPVTLSGTNIGMTEDCPDLLAWNAQWFYFELPYASNDVTITLTSTTDLGTAGIIVMNDCNCDDYIVSSYSFASPTIIQTWTLDGPGNYYFPAYALDSSGEPVDYTVTFDVTEHTPCIVECPEGAVAEAEACGDDANGGCNMSTPTFNPINFDETVCGTIWASGGTRDTDWYEIVTDGGKIFTFSAEGEFGTLGMVIGLVATSPDGNPDCGTASSLSPYATGGECTPISITTDCMPAGTYWFFVSALGYDGLPCDSNNDYVCTLTATDCVIMGACCYNEGYDCADNQDYECDALGGVWWAEETCATHVCETPCEEATILVEIHTDNYPSETTWEVTDYYTGATIDSGGPYSYLQYTYQEQVCVPFNGCYNFTIFDAWGDGICCSYGYGYYNVYFQDELICTGGEFDSQETCAMFGDDCTPPSYACCSPDLVCIGDMTEADCDTAGGRWIAGELCSEGYVCVDCDVDFCYTAPVADVTGSTCGANDDCALRAGVDIEVRVTIPEAGLWTFSLCGSDWDTYMFVGTSRCGQEVGYNDDYCGLQSELSAYVEAGDYYIDIESYNSSACGNYVLNVYMQETCEVDCPPDGTPEGEPDCYENYEDVTNGGCNSNPYVFSPITCNETVCGTSGTYVYSGSSYRDTDWYQIELPAATTLTWECCATFAPYLFIIDGNYGCDGATILNSATGSAYISVSCSYTVEAGTYWLWVGPASFSGVECGSAYVATLTADPDVCMCGDFDDDNDVDVDDFYFFLDAYGTCIGDIKYEAACDFDGDECITLVDYQAWMQCYRDANDGKSFSVPRPKFSTGNAVARPAGSSQAQPARVR